MVRDLFLVGAEEGSHRHPPLRNRVAHLLHRANIRPSIRIMEHGANNATVAILAHGRALTVGVSVEIDEALSPIEDEGEGDDDGREEGKATDEAEHVLYDGVFERQEGNLLTNGNGNIALLLELG